MAVSHPGVAVLLLCCCLTLVAGFEAVKKNNANDESEPAEKVVEEGGPDSSAHDYMLEHAVGAGPFTARTSVGVSFSRLSRVGTVSVAESRLSGDTLTELKAALDADPGALYRIRLVPAAGNAVAASSPVVAPTAAVRACALVASDFRELIVLHADLYGHLLSVDYRTPEPECRDPSRTKVPASAVVQSKARISMGRAGEAPNEQFTPEAIREKVAATQEEQQQGFFAKYWKYIVPFGIILLLQMVAAPKEGEGGGGGR